MLLVSFDGFRWDFTTKYNLKLDNFERLKKRGVSIKSKNDDDGWLLRRRVGPSVTHDLKSQNQAILSIVMVQEGIEHESMTN